MGAAPLVGKHMSRAVRRAAWLALLIATVLPASAATRTLVVSGLGGETKYAEAFAAIAESAAESARGTGAEVTLLTGASATRETIRDALAELGRVSTEEDAAVVHLFGHGSYDGETFRFNVPGPDPTDEDLKDWLGALRPARQLVVVATSASGALAEPLRREGRTVIAATKSGTEQSAVVFGDYWLEALRAPSADTNKDGAVGAAEAFRFTNAAVERHFEARGLMATEHARMEGPESGILVSRLEPERLPDANARRLAARRAEIEEAIAGLRGERDAMEIDAYFARLRELLLELAVIERELSDGP